VDEDNKNVPLYVNWH